MKVLFVCKWNMGRSQMAVELFNLYSKKNIGISAGTNTIPFSKQKLKDVAPLTVRVLQEKNIDISFKNPIRLTKEIVHSVDRVVILTQRDDVPNYLVGLNKVMYWNVEDGDGKDYSYHIQMREQIDTLIKELVREIG